jgi:acetoin utilization deacetylase AcuC-like enzyme
VLLCTLQVELPHGTGDEGYLAQLDAALHTASSVCPQPDLVMYIAGVDVLAGDRSGRQAVTAAGVVARDERVFRWAAGSSAGVFTFECMSSL